MPEQLLIGFNPMAAANRVAYCARLIRSRVVWFLVAAGITVWIWVWQRRGLSGQDVGWLFGISLTFSAAWLVIAIISWLRAKSALARISPGVAVAVDRNGMWLQGATLAWENISRVALKPGRFGGSPLLEVSPAFGIPVRISVADLDTMPGSIDAAVRAYSGGARGVDTSRLGN